MLPLPLPWRDLFSSGALSTPAATTTGGDAPLELTIDATIVAPDGTALGRVSRNRYDHDSITNEYGVHGGRYSQTSIFNQYGPYGSRYSATSPFNQYSTTPPVIHLRNGHRYYLTVNPYISPRIDPVELAHFLGIQGLLI
jgi:hypothetical protein